MSENSYQQAAADFDSSRKKAEMKKRTSPTPPYREKAKGKEIPDANGISCVCMPLRTRGRARARKAAMIERWRECVFADTKNDPVKDAVEFAVEKFGSKQDRRLWCWYANRIGVNTFIDQVFEVESSWRQGEIRCPSAAFHKRLQDILQAISERTGGVDEGREDGSRRGEMRRRAKLGGKVAEGDREATRSAREAQREKEMGEKGVDWRCRCRGKKKV